MFDLITGNVIHAPRPRVTPVIVSIGAHAATSALSLLVLWFSSLPVAVLTVDVERASL